MNAPSFTRRSQHDRILVGRYTEMARETGLLRPQRFTDEHLLWATFDRETGPWRQAYDRHVRDWQRAVHEDICIRCVCDPRFAQDFEARQNKRAESHTQWLASLPWGATRAPAGLGEG